MLFNCYTIVMETKNLNHLFNDDFIDLFNEANMEIDEIQKSQESLSTYLEMLQDETSIQKRLESIQNLAKLVPKTSVMVLDDKILQYLLPAAQDLLVNIFKEICQTLSTSKTQQNGNETLKILQEYLQMCIIVHEVLGCILDYVLQNQHVTLRQIQSLPSNMLAILLLTFQHCKASDKTYKNYVDDLKEIVWLFKATQEVHTKLLKLLENHVDFNVLLDEEIVVLKNVLEVLGEIGEVLVDTNVKALADNWKSYMNLTQNFAEVLNNNSFDISKPVSFISNEISRKLKIVLKMDAVDAKGVGQILKLCNFFIRVALKLCETFWTSLERICACVLDFLLSMYNFHPSFLKFKECPERIIAQINSSVFVCSEQLLHKLLCHAEFFKAASDVNVKETKSPGLLLLFMAVFQKLHTLTGPNRITQTCNVYPVIDTFFEIVKNSYSELFWKLKIPTAGEQRSLYDESVINISHTVLSLNAKEYNQIQLILFRNVLQDQIWGALLATDVWCLILRKNPPQLCCETLLQIIVKTEPILSNFTSRPEKTFAENLIQRIYMSLPEQYKGNIVEKCPPAFNIHIWKTLGFKNFPKQHIFVIESLLINFMEKIDLLKGGKCHVNDFNFLCNGFEAISSLSVENEIDLNYLVRVLATVWDFKPDKDLRNSEFFRVFMQNLCRATWNFMMYFDNEQLTVILTKLNQMLNDNFDLKIQAIQMISALSSKTLQQSQEQNQIMSTLSEIFRTLLKCENPIIREAALEAFVDFLNNTPHENIAHHAIRGEDDLQRPVSNYIQKYVQDDGGRMSGDGYFLNQKSYKFKHVCPEGQMKVDHLAASLLNKFKIDKDEINVLVKRIKSDVISLHKMFGKINVSEEHADEIVNILSRQIDYKI